MRKEGDLTWPLKNRIMFESALKLVLSMPSVLRKSSERGRTKIGWLDSRHSFSFSDYYDPKHINYGVLRVINEDKVEPGQGFSTHSHRDMEIISIVVEGELQHKDSIGNGSIIKPGDVQKMSAGTGIQHSEFNPSQTQPVHFLQIWIIPNREGHMPSYDQKHFSASDLENKLRLIASPDGNDGSIQIHQNASLFRSFLRKDQKLSYSIAPSRMVWFQVIKGECLANEQTLSAGDGAGIDDPTVVEITAKTDSDFLLFDVPSSDRVLIGEDV